MKLGSIEPPRNRPFYKDDRLELSMEDGNDGKIISFTCVLDGVKKIFKVTSDPLKTFNKLEAYLRKLKIVPKFSSAQLHKLKKV